MGAHLGNVFVQQPEGVAHIEVLPVEYEAAAIPLLQRLYQLINQLVILLAPHTLLRPPHANVAVDQKHHTRSRKVSSTQVYM